MKRRHLLVPLGRWDHPQGTQVIDQDAIDRIVKAAVRTGRDIPVDFEHQSFFQPSAQRAGSIAPSTLSAGPEGISGEVEWTERADELVRSGAYRYLSPALAYKPAHLKCAPAPLNELHIERLVGLGLTNHPNIAAMKPLFNQRNLKEETMLELLAKLKAALGLPPDADDAQTIGMAVERLSRPPTPATETPGEPPESAAKETAEPASEDAAKPASGSAVKTVGSEEFLALKKEIADLKQKQLTDQVYASIAEGKLLPAQKDWALTYAASDPEGFRQFVSNSRTVVNMGSIIPGAARAAGGPPLSPEQERMNTLLGISREVHNRHNP